jgi:hypothetical protein
MNAQHYHIKHAPSYICKPNKGNAAAKLDRANELAANALAP